MRYTAIERKDLDADIKVLINDRRSLVLNKGRKNIPAIHSDPQDFNTRQEYETQI